MKIRLLGTGTPTPSLRRMCSGYVVEIGDAVILFDHGFGAHHRLLEAGIPATRITHLFLSHLHYDHCGDYPRLVLTRWDQGAGLIPELKVYGPPPLQEMTDRLFGPQGAFDPDIVSRVRHDISLSLYVARGGTLPRERPVPSVIEVRSGDTVSDGNDWSVEVAAVNHVQPYLACYGFRLNTPEGSFVYSGDSGPSTGMRKLAKDCDVLVHMCHYISGTAYNTAFAEGCMGHKELAQLAQEAGVRNLVATHITEQFDKPGMREHAIAEITRIYKGNLFFGEDLMVIPAKAPVLDRLL
jgi:ribonuclease BN (tRNA processing enzyme)